MRRAFILFFILVVLVSCNSVNSLKLTEEEARSLIIEKNGFDKPKPIAIYLHNIELYSALCKEIERLEREGYLTKKYKGTGIRRRRTQSRRHLLITEKGKELIEFIEFGRVPINYYTFAPFTHYLDLLGIKEIVINNKDKTAVVKYKVGYRVTDYFIHLSQIDKETMDEASQNLKGYGKEMWLKKTEQGWQVTKDVNLPMDNQ